MTAQERIFHSCPPCGIYATPTQAQSHDKLGHTHSTLVTTATAVLNKVSEP